MDYHEPTRITSQTRTLPMLSMQPDDTPNYDALELTQVAPATPTAFVPPPAPLLYMDAFPPVQSAQGDSRSKMLVLLVGVCALAVASVIVLGAVFVRGAATRPPDVDSAPTMPPLAPTVTPVTIPTILPTTQPTNALAIQPWNGKSRFTVLLMGLDKRPNEGGTAFRTDVLMVISLDPVTRSVGILSVPRDLFVTIPPGTIVGNSYGLQRINTPYVIGKSVRAGSGPMLAMQTVQYNLGIQINSYVVVDFQAVTALVDAIGGVDIDVPRTISDPAYPDMYGGYDPLYIPAGRIHMDGTLALKYARTRHGSDDLERARRQQQVISTMRDKVLSGGMVPRLVAQAPILWAQLANHVKSDLSLDQLLQLAMYAKDISAENIHRGVVDYGYTTPTNYNGASVLVPNRAQMGALLTQVFGANYNR